MVEDTPGVHTGARRYWITCKREARTSLPVVLSLVRVAGTRGIPGPVQRFALFAKVPADVSWAQREPGAISDVRGNPSWLWTVGPRWDVLKAHHTVTKDDGGQRQLRIPRPGV